MRLCLGLTSDQCASAGCHSCVHVGEVEDIFMGCANNVASCPSRWSNASTCADPQDVSSSSSNNIVPVAVGVPVAIGVAAIVIISVVSLDSLG